MMALRMSVIAKELKKCFEGKIIGGGGGDGLASHEGMEKIKEVYGEQMCVTKEIGKTMIHQLLFLRCLISCERGQRQKRLSIVICQLELQSSLLQTHGRTHQLVLLSGLNL